MALFHALQEAEIELMRLQGVEKELSGSLSQFSATIEAAKIKYTSSIEGMLRKDTAVTKGMTANGAPAVSSSTHLASAIAASKQHASCFAQQSLTPKAMQDSDPQPLLAKELAASAAAAILARATAAAHHSCERLAQEDVTSAARGTGKEALAQQYEVQKTLENRARHVGQAVTSAQAQLASLRQAIAAAEARAVEAGDAVLVATGKLDKAQARQAAMTA